MKLLICLLAFPILSGFSTFDDSIDGVWMGYYRSSYIKEKMIVKFNESDKMEFYTGGVDDRSRSEGSYRIMGDSVSIVYTTAEGAAITMAGHFNRRKNFVDGVWKEGNKIVGSFYLEKQKIQEYYAQP